MGTVQNALLLVLILLPTYYAACIYRNYLAARKLGIPIIILPFDNLNPIWLLVSRPLHRLLTRVGFPNVLRLRHLGMEYTEKAAPFVELRCNAFVQVTPGANWISLADPVGATQVYQAERRGDAGRPMETSEMLGVFGPNVTTSRGAQYQRMKKVTATSFNEGTNRSVWAESLMQGDAMLRSWLAAGEDGVRSTADATRQVAMNIMLCAGFGKKYDFESNPPSGGRDEEAMDFRKAMEIVLKNAILIMGIGPENLPKLGHFSRSLDTLSKAVSTFRSYMVETVDQGYKEGLDVQGRGNLLGALVRALHEDKQLSEAEVYGNCFVYLFGGHDTTAHTLAFTFMLLSINPEVQDWMREELRRELDGDDYRNWKYESHPNLKRTLAVQLETIRLFNPLLGISKGVPLGHSCQLSLDGGKTMVTVPGGTHITVNTNAIHTLPEYWGADALEWRPSRWIQTDDEGTEKVLTPEKGLFYGWSDGMRACPGKKFGHLEHMALMASIIRDHVVEPAAENGESFEETRQRIMGVVKDSGMVLNVQMFHPEKASLVWRRC